MSVAILSTFQRNNLAYNHRKGRDNSVKAGDVISEKKVKQLVKMWGSLPSGVKVHREGNPGQLLYTTGEGPASGSSNSSFVNSGNTNSTRTSSSTSSSGTTPGTGFNDIKSLMDLQFGQDTKSMERAFQYRTKESAQRYGQQQGLAQQGFEHQTGLNKQNFAHQTQLNTQQFQNTSALSKQDFGQTRTLNQDRFGHEKGQQERGHAHQLASMRLQNQLGDEDWRRNRQAAQSTFKSGRTFS